MDTPYCLIWTVLFMEEEKCWYFLRWTCLIFSWRQVFPTCLLLCWYPEVFLFFVIFNIVHIMSGISYLYIVCPKFFIHFFIFTIISNIFFCFHGYIISVFISFHYCDYMIFISFHFHSSIHIYNLVHTLFIFIFF